MARNTSHLLQPRTHQEGMSRRLAVLASKRAIRTTLEPRLRGEYEARNNEEDFSALSLQAYGYWASASRASQDRMWALLSDQIDADYARISLESEKVNGQAGGTLHLDGNLNSPGYLEKSCIHGQPGGYMLERNTDDLAAGILYEAGGNIYAMGQGIGARDSKGERLIAHVRESYASFAPRKILEMGCSAGAQSTDYPQAFPDAEFHAIDLSPGMLRYAHARAEALGVPVQFHQADAAATGFADASFDLVISHNMFHEVAAGHMPSIIDECYRLLAPGGVCIHQDVPIQQGRFEGFQNFLSEWQKDNNDEPFWLDFANADLPAMMVDAGFDKSGISEEYLDAIDGPIPWYVVSGIK